MVGTYTGSYAISNNATYGPSAGTTTLNGSLYVNSDATLQNLTVNGTIYVNPGENGNVTLNNVTASNIVILSGAANSIHLNNVRATNLTVKDDNSIRIESTGTTAITNTFIQSGAILEATAGSFGTIELAPTSSNPITLKGNFGSSAISVTAPNSVVDVATGSTVGTLTIDAAANGTAINNAGTITEVKANAENVAIEGIQPGTITPGPEVGLTASVGSEAEFKAALEKGYSIINLTESFEVDAPLQINKKVTLNGNNRTITKSDKFIHITTAERVKVNSVVIASIDGTKITHLTVDAVGEEGWESLYALQVYNATDVLLEGVILKNGDGGLLVNGSAVTVNNITTSGNEFGGIEVSKGTEAGLSNSKLTINGKPQHLDASGKPAVWVYPSQGTLVSDLYVETATQQGTANNQTYYDLKIKVDVSNALVAVQTAIDNLPEIATDLEAVKAAEVLAKAARALGLTDVQIGVDRIAKLDAAIDYLAPVTATVTGGGEFNTDGVNTVNVLATSKIGAKGLEGTHFTGQAWANSNAQGFQYTSDGAFYTISLTKAGQAVEFGTVFETFKLQTQGSDNSQDYGAKKDGRTPGDFFGVAPEGGHKGTSIYANGSNEDGTLYYGIHSSIFGVNYKNGDTAAINLTGALKANAVNGEYKITVTMYAPARATKDTKHTSVQSLKVLGSTEYTVNVPTPVAKAGN